MCDPKLGLSNISIYCEYYKLMMHYDQYHSSLKWLCAIASYIAAYCITLQCIRIAMLLYIAMNNDMINTAKWQSKNNSKLAVPCHNVCYSQ